jgi:mgtE-like transporter
MRDDNRHQTTGWLRLPLRWLGTVAVALVGRPARALRGTARRVGDPAHQVADYFRSERRTVRQGFLAVSTASLTSLLAGLTLAAMDHRIRAVDGLFVLIPVSIGMRGNIFGALAARLGTSIHTGLFEVSRRKEGILYQNIHAAILLTIATSVTMALLGRGIAASLGIETVSVWDLVTVALAGGLLSSLVVLAVTVFLSVTSLRRGWDLDSVGAPLITAIGDVVTLPCLLAASYLVGLSWVTPTLGGLALAAALGSLVRGWTTLASVTRRVVRQSFPVLCVAIVLDVLAGTVVQPRVESVFLAFPALLIVIPGFLENTGALGSILAARLGSKLHLGAISPSPRPGAVALLDGSIVLLLGMTVYAITTVATLVIATTFGIDTPGTLRFIGIVLMGGALATLLASLIGYYAATLTYRLGLDPDNYTIPLVTSGMDLIGVICLVVALVVFGVG